MIRPGRNEVFLSVSASGTVEAPPESVRKGRISLPEAFCLDSGEVLVGPEVHYSLLGPSNGPLVVVLGGISATRDVATAPPSGPLGWWNEMVGPGLPVDTGRFRVLAIDWLGKHSTLFRPSTNGSREACTSLEGTGRCPVISTRDQARALAHVLDKLETGPIHTFVGSSYGGMVGLAFAAEFPDLVDRLVVISGAHRTHPMATAHRVVQRRIVGLGGANGSVDDGLALSRALAMTTYRSIEEFEERFATPSISVAGDHRFEVEEYLLAQGSKFCTRITPEAFLCLSLSIDTHDIAPASVGIPTDLISVTSDTLVPPWLMKELEEGLAGPCRHHQIDSIFGHDAFLKEAEAIGSLLIQILDREDLSS